MDALIKIFSAKYEGVDVNIPMVAAESSVVQNVFNVALGAAGAIAVALIVFAGIKYSLSQGKPEETNKARNTIIYSLVGIVVVILAFIVVNFVVGQF